MRLHETGQRILRFLHIAAMACWMGSALSVFCLVWLAPWASSDGELCGMLRAAAVIEQCVLVPAGAFGTFFTGLSYSLCTHRGFIRYPWIAAKWLITVVLVLFGVLCMGQWSGQELDMVHELGLAAYARPDIAALHQSRWYGCAFVIVMLASCMALAVFRPGERRPWRRAGQR